MIVELCHGYDTTQSRQLMSAFSGYVTCRDTSHALRLMSRSSVVRQHTARQLKIEHSHAARRRNTTHIARPPPAMGWDTHTAHWPRRHRAMAPHHTHRASQYYAHVSMRLHRSRITRPPPAMGWDGTYTGHWYRGAHRASYARRAPTQHERERARCSHQRTRVRSPSRSRPAPAWTRGTPARRPRCRRGGTG